MPVIQLCICQDVNWNCCPGYWEIIKERLLFSRKKLLNISLSKFSIQNYWFFLCTASMTSLWRNCSRLFFLEPLRISRYGTKSKPKTKYQKITTNHTIEMSMSTTGTITNHFRYGLVVFVIFQILAAEPWKDIGAETTTRSEASLLFTLIILASQMDNALYVTMYLLSYAF